MAALTEDEIRSRIVAATSGSSPQGLATAVRGLIQSGGLPSGTRLPTVRILAKHLHASASTVSAAWAILAREGIIHSSGRNGTIVLRQRAVENTKRLGQMTWIVGRHGLDLSTGTPDSALLPKLPTSFIEFELAAVENYQGPTILPALEEFVRCGWPGDQSYAMTMMHGAYDAIDRVLLAVLRPGDRVVVEDPTAPGVVDLVESHGGVPIPVSLDNEGVEPESLSTALLTRPSALILQPRAQNPTGAVMSWARAEQLASMLRPSKALVVEDDHCGAVSMAPLATLGRWLPDRVVRIQSFSKSHGPDLRLAAVGAPNRLMHQMELRRRLAGGWESRVLQRLLLGMLEDPTATAVVDAARTTYHRRRAAMAEAVHNVGLRTLGSDGLNLWVEVEHEGRVMQRLAERDIGVCPGSPLNWSNRDTTHIRITTAALEAGADEVARIVAGLCVA